MCGGSRVSWVRPVRRKVAFSGHLRLASGLQSRNPLGYRVVKQGQHDPRLRSPPTTALTESGVTPSFPVGILTLAMRRQQHRQAWHSPSYQYQQAVTPPPAERYQGRECQDLDPLLDPIGRIWPQKCTPACRPTSPTAAPRGAASGGICRTRRWRQINAASRCRCGVVQVQAGGWFVYTQSFKLGAHSSSSLFEPQD